jgi:methylated-DNA-[protein]-cysteine S-methyltransferase
MACEKNPLPILIPCHRVIGKKEPLTVFSAGEGIDTKKFLLQLEVPNVYFNIFN